MQEDYKKEIEELIGQIQCQKGFECYKSGLDVLCKAKDIGLELVLECLEEGPAWCKFSFSYGDSYFCECPLRVFILKKLKK
jgi:hypothetical protein